jgi:hypothetical protein
LILDGTAVRMRLDRKATNISLVVLGVRRDGQKVLLAVKNMGGGARFQRRSRWNSAGGGESEAAWRSVLDDLIVHGLRTPDFLITDGGAGLERALAALWPDVPAQRCRVHTIRTQSCGGPDWTVAVRGWGTQWDDMADLQAAIAHDDALDDELQDRLLLGQGRIVQPAADAIAERRHIGPHCLGLELLLA